VHEGRKNVRGLAAPLMLLSARARGRPGRWLLTALGIALAAAFVGAVLAEGTIAGDRGARSVLAGLAPLDRTVRVTWQGVVTPSVRRNASALLSGLGLGAQTEVVLLNPVRLGGAVVRPAAIEPLAGWLAHGSRTLPNARGRPGPCLPRACPVLIAGATLPRTPLVAAGVRMPILGRAELRSAVPLGFIPGSDSQEPPLAITSDASGLERLAGLSGVYRTHSWLAPLRTSELHAWQLASTELRLQHAQAALLSSASQFSLSAPFSGLDAARAQADAAPGRLLLAGGGAVTALLLFVVLAAGGLRRDQHAELERLRAAGARVSQCMVFVLGEAALLCGVALLLGAALALGAAALLADAAGSPVGGVLAHSLLTPAALGVLVGGWLCASTLVAVLLVATGPRLADVAAVAAAAALTLALALNRDTGADDPLPVLLAPLCCLAAGVIVFRAAAVLLRAGERVARPGPVLVRLAFAGLARSPAAPSLAIAFIAVSTGLGGFALAYRATLLRGTADQAADMVPLDAIVASGPDFIKPLALAPAARWESLAAGPVLQVRRTEASFVTGDATETVPALGVPAGVLPRLHGWRASDGSAPMATLARRLSPPGATRAPGPLLAPGARFLSLRVSAPGIGVRVSADLRTGAGAIRQIPLGDASTRTPVLRAALPAGRWELEALELDEPTGLELTNGHQNGENGAAATQFATRVSLGPLRALGRSGRSLASVRLGGWRAVGASSSLRETRATTVVRFASTGAPGVIRPLQPSDLRPVPVLVDAQTAAAAGRDRRLALTIDGVPVAATVVGTLRRFPTLPSDAAGFVVADEQTLAGALDAQLPGQGSSDELWLSTGNLTRLRAALRSGPLAQLSYKLRTDIERQLQSAPIARGVLGILVAAAALSAVLAVLGLLVSLLGAARDERVESDLVAQGVGPRGLRRELRLRMLLAAALGVLVGVGVAGLLTPLAVAGVRAATTLAVPRPPLVTVAPWVELGLWALGALGVLAAAAWAATRSLIGRRPLA
jgi:hypothetical protein